MSERLRKKTIESWFFPAMRGEMLGHIPVAPPLATEKRDELKKNWLMQHPRMPKEAPMVSLSPGYNKNGQKGFFVKTEIVYRS